ncbi:hypothetical protein CASFOL_012180 [Castilleja foliolosa]|uniref:Uncharacterized protein n=1 Tax=Castilleja foliolosa TaxID=1961234 RepID=A0ABD3DPM5_9LAMI
MQAANSSWWRDERSSARRLQALVDGHIRGMHVIECGTIELPAGWFSEISPMWSDIRSLSVESEKKSTFSSLRRQLHSLLCSKQMKKCEMG